MKYSYAFQVLLLLVLLWGSGCNTKEINLITNIDFELDASGLEGGYVRDSLATAVIITPQSVEYPGFQYFSKYTISAGEGYFVSADNSVIPADKDLALPLQGETYLADWNYIGTQAGTHRVRIEAKDNYGRHKVTDLVYEIKPIALLWEASGSQTMGQVNDTISLTLQLENLSAGVDLTYTRTMGLSEGTGILLDASKEPLAFDIMAAIAEGTHALYYIPAMPGKHELQFDLKASPDTEKTTTLSFDIEEILVNEPPIIVADEAETTATTAITIPVLENDTDPEGDVLTITAVEEPTNGTATIENNEIRYTPNDGFVGKEVFGYTIMDSAGNEVEGEVITITVSPRATIAIPDDNFEAALIALGLDEVPDNKMFKDVAEGITSLDVSYKEDDSIGKIESLEGIEYFVSLQELMAKNNEIKTIDITKNSELLKVDFESNQIAFIDLTKNRFLESLGLWKNRIATIDISNNANLIQIDLDENELATLDLSNNPNLEVLALNSNKIVSLDVDTNTKLRVLSLGYHFGTAHNNLITDLDIKNLPNLETIGLRYLSNLTSVDFSFNPKLKHIYAEGSALTALDLTANPNLVQVFLQDNSLQSVDLKNGANGTLAYLNLSGNNDLSCIQVDNIATANSHIDWQKDDTAYYSLDCARPRATISIPDANFEQALIDLGHDSGQPDQKMFKDVAERITNLSLDNKGIENLEGIEYFKALEYLSAKGNSISSVELSGNVLLRTLNLTNNSLTTVDLSNQSLLTAIYLQSNELTTIDVTNNTALAIFQVGYNQITSVDLTKNASLRTVGVFINELDEIDLSQNKDITFLDLTGNNLTTIDLSQNTELRQLGLSKNQLSSIDLSSNIALYEIELNNNQLVEAVFLSNTALNRITLNNNDLSRLNVSNITALSSLNALNNPKLSCILVDDVVNANAQSSWLKDATATYNTVCP